MRKPLVFISHSTHDRTVAGIVCQALERKHIPCWIAPRDVPLGLNAFDAIPAGIHDCKVFVLILSGNASQSDYVQRELQMALTQKRTIIPLRIEDIQLDGAVNFLLTGVQWLDAFVPPLERHIDALVARIAGVLEVEIASSSGYTREPESLPKRKAVSGSARYWLAGATALALALLAAGVGFVRLHAAAPPVATATTAVQPSAPAPLVNAPVVPDKKAVTAKPGPPPPTDKATTASRTPAATAEPVTESTPEQLRARAAVLTGKQKVRDQDYVSAENYFRLALELDPDNAEAKAGLQAMRKALGEI